MSNVSNLSKTLLASAVRAATNSSNEVLNEAANSIHVVIDVTAVPGVDTVTFSIEGKDPASGRWYTLLTSAAVVATTAAAPLVLRVGPGLTAAANLVANDVVPRVFRVTATHSAATNFTYSVGVNLID